MLKVEIKLYFKRKLGLKELAQYEDIMWNNFLECVQIDNILFCTYYINDNEMVYGFNKIINIIEAIKKEPNTQPTEIVIEVR